MRRRQAVELASGDPLPDLLMISNMNELPLLYSEGIIEPFGTGHARRRQHRPLRLCAGRSGGRDVARAGPGSAALKLHQHAYLRQRSLRTRRCGRAIRIVDVDANDRGGKRLTYADESGSQWGTYAHASVPLLLSMIWSHGGEVFDAQNGIVRLTEPAALKGIELWRDMITFHQIAPNPPEGTFALMRSNRNGMQVVSFDQLPQRGGGGGGGGGGAQPQRNGALGHSRKIRRRPGSGRGADLCRATAGRRPPGYVGFAGRGHWRGRTGK